MAGAVRAELLKLRKRPAVWVLFAVLLATLVLFGYAVTYLFAVSDFAGGAAEEGQALLPGLLPEAFIASAVGGLAGFGGPFGLLLGALAAGSEYGWGTVKTIATQRPSRLALGAGKAVGIGAVALLFAIAYLVTALLCSVVVAGLEEAAVALPSAGSILAGLGAAWLVLLVWAALGVVLSVLFRGTGLAIGLGLVYVLVLEQIALALPLPERLNEALGSVLIGSNTLALAQHFGDVSTAQMLGIEVAAGQAAAVLALYVAVSLAIAALTFHRREIA